MTLSQYRTLSLNEVGCPRCDGLLVEEVASGEEGWVRQAVCVNCGHRDQGYLVTRYSAYRQAAPRGCQDLETHVRTNAGELRLRQRPHGPSPGGYRKKETA